MLDCYRRVRHRLRTMGCLDNYQVLQVLICVTVQLNAETTLRYLTC